MFSLKMDNKQTIECLINIRIIRCVLTHFTSNPWVNNVFRSILTKYVNDQKKFNKVYKCDRYHII